MLICANDAVGAAISITAAKDSEANSSKGMRRVDIMVPPASLKFRPSIGYDLKVSVLTPA
jgi:hypothetical protein